MATPQENRRLLHDTMLDVRDWGLVSVANVAFAAVERQYAHTSILPAIGLAAIGVSCIAMNYLDSRRRTEDSSTEATVGAIRVGLIGLVGLLCAVRSETDTRAKDFAATVFSGIFFLGTINGCVGFVLRHQALDDQQDS